MMKKNILYTMMLLVGGLMFAACGGDDTPETPDGPSVPEEREWNRDNTLNVCYITALNDASANANVETVAAYINSNGIKTAVVDNTDIVKYADPTACVNASTQLSFLSAKFCSFVMEGYNGDDIEGSTIVLNHKINKVQTEKIADDCFLQFVPTQGPSMTTSTKMLDLPLAVVKFTSQSQIDAAEDALKKFNGNAYKAIYIGEVKTALAEQLKSKMAALNIGMSFVAEPVGEYTLFVAGRSNYVLRQSTTETVGSQTAFCLSIEVQ